MKGKYDFGLEIEFEEQVSKMLSKIETLNVEDEEEIEPYDNLWNLDEKNDEMTRVTLKSKTEQIIFNNPERITFNQKKAKSIVPSGVRHDYKRIGNKSYFSNSTSDTIDIKNLCKFNIQKKEDIPKFNIFDFFCKIKTYPGSKYFQDQLNVYSQDFIQNLFYEISSAIPDLIKDKFANYFLQKLYEYLPFIEKVSFLKRIGENFFEIANDFIGSYSLQSMIENISSDEEKSEIVKAIMNEKNLLARIVISEPAVYVLEKIVTYFEESHLVLIKNFLIQNFLDLAYHKTGICIIKRLVSKVTNGQSRKIINKIILDNFLPFIQDMYANFTIQLAIEVFINFNI